jgi:predicted TIM-barrel fold metal-dependent hydrolase
MLIDFHTHIFPPQIKNNREKYLKCDPIFGLLYSNPQAKLADADDLIASMNKQAVDISVVLNIAWQSPDLCRETNYYILESVSRFPDRLIGFGMIAQESLQLALKEIEFCARYGLKGIGEIRPSKRELHNLAFWNPVVTKMIENNLILVTHSSEPLGHDYTGKGDITPDLLFSYITEFQGLKLICAHWGGGLPFYALMPEVKKSLENVFFDSAASPYLYAPEIYKCAAELVGTEKILFGTDYPLLSAQRYLKEIDSLNLDLRIKKQILSENAKKLLGIKDS